MSMNGQTYRGGLIFDGSRLLEDHALIIGDGRIEAIVPEAAAPADGAGVIDLEGDIICPGYVDLQVNGGGGVLFNDEQTVSGLRKMCQAHARLGATTIFPTLITDAPERSVAAIEAVGLAIAEGVDGIGGLHLEGPHLSLARKGAHDPALIRPMTDRDLARLTEAARLLPALMVTLAPENATLDQVAELTGAGVIVSLGHSDADFDTCMAYAAAGATCVTHLFNAMSQFGHRAPGMVGAALSNPGLSAGLIADGIHVHSEAVRVALAAKRGPGAVFLVSDAMSPAGTGAKEFQLNGRTIRRKAGRLQLPDGTLAGADLDLTTAIDVLVRRVGIGLATALRMATSDPARVGRQPKGVGHLVPGEACRLVRLSVSNSRSALTLADVLGPEIPPRLET
jgi:N-acetylglucosamine-6-phosphate deacetylase